MERTFYIESLELANDFEFYILNLKNIEYNRVVNDYFYEFKIIGNPKIITEVSDSLNSLKNRKHYYKPLSNKDIINITLEVVRNNKITRPFGVLEVITTNWENPKKKYSEREFRLSKSKRKTYHLTDKPNRKGFYTLYDYTSTLKRNDSNRKRYASKDREVLIRKIKELFGE